MRKVAKAIQKAAANHVRDDSWKTRIDAQRKAEQRGDTWQNTITAFGVLGRDKRLGGKFLTDRVIDLEAEDVWRGDDCAGRAVETVPNQIVRAGFEVIIKSDDPKEKDKKARFDWLRSTKGRQWWNEKIDNLATDDATKKMIREKIRADLASDVFPEPAQAESDDSSKEQSEATNAYMDDLGVLDTVGEAMKAERGYGGAAIFPGIIDGVKDLTRPLDYNRIQSVDWLDVLTPLELIPYQWYSDPTEKNYGRPELYWMQRISIGNIGSTTRIPIHESRLIKFPGLVVSRRQLREHWGWGDSVLVRMMEVLRDFQTSWQGAAILLGDFAQAVMSIEGLAESFASGDPNDAGLLVARATALDTGRSIARAVLIDAKEKFERQSTPVTGMPDLLDRFCNRLAAAAHMPVTILMGQAPAGLNATGDSDIRSFYDNIGANRERQLKPRLTQLLKMIFAAKQGPTNGAEPDNWSWKFGALWQPTEKEEAERRYIVAQADMIYIQAGVLIPEEVAISRWGGDAYSPETHLDRTVRESFDAKAEEEAQAQADQIQSQVEGDAKAKVEHAKAAGAAGFPLKGQPPAKDPAGKPAIVKKDAEPFAPATRPATLPWTSTGELTGGLGIARGQMPQIVSAVAQEFLDGLGVRVETGWQQVGQLKPMQASIRPEKVTELLEKFPPETLKKPIIVSGDGYILDGHHRWAALRLKGAGEEIQTRTVDMPGAELLAAARRFPKAEYRDAFNEADFERDEKGKFSGGGGGEKKGSGRATAGSLPDEPYRYFEKTPDSMLVPLSKLETIRARPDGIQHAAVHMAKAYNGEGDKRKPISLKANGDGTFTVLDGNSTTAMARQHGWSHIVGVVESAGHHDSDPDWYEYVREDDFNEANVERDEKGRFAGGGGGGESKGNSPMRALKELKAEQLPKAKSKPLPAGHTEAQHQEIAAKALAEHQRVLPAEKDRLKNTVGPGLEVKARTKAEESALNKIREKPKYGTVDKLQDLTGMRVVAPDINGVHQAVAKIKSAYEVVEHDDYINNPKAGYRSYHMIVKTSAGLAEVQVRTANQNRFANWSHNIYKPHDRAQERLANHPSMGRLVEKVSEHFWALDNGRASTPPHIPGAVRLVFGSPL